MKRIIVSSFLLLLIFTGCNHVSSEAEKNLNETLHSMAANYTQPDDTPDSEWEKTALLRAKKNLANDESTDPQFLALLGQDESVNVVVLVAKNASTPKDTLEQFLNSPDEVVRNYLAANPSLPESFYDQLSRDDSPNVRQAAAKNCSNSTENLKLLATDSDDNVQHFLARNECLTAEVMLVMAENSPVSALEILLKSNPNIPTEVLEVLKNHSSTSIRTKVVDYNAAESATGAE